MMAKTRRAKTSTATSDVICDENAGIKISHPNQKQSSIDINSKKNIKALSSKTIENVCSVSIDSTTALTINDVVTNSCASASNDETDRVSVILRVRPLIKKELCSDTKLCLQASGLDQIVIGVGAERYFKFDRVFDMSSNQHDVYHERVSPLVKSLFDGYNCCIIAYGQTGTGKTYTMGGHVDIGNDADRGVIPRVVEQLFSIAGDRSDDYEISVRASYLEIYNEDVRDLLRPETPSHQIYVREDSDRKLYVIGLHTELVETSEKLMECLRRGTACRTVGATLMNSASSRSHSIFTITLEQRRLRSGIQSVNGNSTHTHIFGNVTDGIPVYISAKFHLVDLAGSERNKRTGNTGIRMKESVSINQGLLALGNVISCLGDESKKAAHVPYRSSKLTRLLQDSLGGNSKTLMIACVSPASSNFEETLNTLKYANRAKNIRNTPTINKDPQSAIVLQLKCEIESLKLELLKFKNNDTGVNENERHKHISMVQGIVKLVKYLQSMTAAYVPLSDVIMWLHKLSDGEDSLCLHTSTPSDIILKYEKCLQELQEATEDLLRDEEIFNEKMKLLDDCIRENELLKLQIENFKANIPLHVVETPNRRTHTPGTPLSCSKHVDFNITPQRRHDAKRLKTNNIDSVQKLIALDAAMLVDSQRHATWRTETDKQLQEMQIKIKLKEEFIRNLIQSERHSMDRQKETEQRIISMQTEIESLRAKLSETITNENESVNSNNIHCNEKIESFLEEIAFLKAQQEQKNIRDSVIEESSEKIKKLEAELKEMHDIHYSIMESANVRERKFDFDQRNAAEERIRLQEREELMHQHEAEIEEKRVEGDKRAAWLEAQLESVMERESAIRELEREIKERELSLIEKEGIESDKNRLHLKHLRSSSGNSNIFSQSSPRSDAVGALNKDIFRLKLQRDDILEKKEELESCLSDLNISSQEESQIVYYDEVLRSLNAEIEYKDTVIDQIREQIWKMGNVQPKNDVDTSVPVISSLTSDFEVDEPLPEGIQHILRAVDLMDRDTARTHLKQAVVSCYRQKTSEISAVSKCDEMSCSYDDAITRLQQAENAIRVMELEHSKRLEELHHQYEYQLKSLIDDLSDETASPSSPNRFSVDSVDIDARIEDGEDQRVIIKELQRDLFFYKQTSRGLKRKLRNHGNDFSPNDYQELVAKNARLETEMKNLKKLMMMRGRGAGAWTDSPGSGLVITGKTTGASSLSANHS